MNAFQYVGSATIVVLLISTFRGARAGRLSRGAALRWSIVWLAGLAAILDPPLTMRLAKILGIGRGTDLMLYIAILAGLAAFLMVQIRLRRLESEITKLVRHMALRDGPTAPEGAVEKASVP